MDCSYVNKIIEKYNKNGQLTQNEKTAYSNLSQTLNNWFNRTYNRYSYYPKMSIQQSGSRAKGTAIKGKSDMDMFLSIEDPKVFPNYRENDMKDKSETDFSMRQNKDKKQKGNIKKSEYLHSGSEKELDI